MQKNMAGYHYKLQIVPSEYSHWESTQPDSAMLEEWRLLLPKNTSWGETEEFRSEYNHSVLYIWWENSRVRSIQFEFAPILKGTDTLLQNILSLCQEYNYKIYSERTGSVVYPSRTELWADFKSGHPFSIYERQGWESFN